MIKRYYRIADVTFEVIGNEEIMSLDRGSLIEYSTEPVCADYTMYFEAVERLTPPEGVCVFSSSDKIVYRFSDGEMRYTGDLSDGYKKADVRVKRCGKKISVQIVFNGAFKYIAPKTVLNSLNIEHIMAENGSFILHASYIKYNNEAILFTAPSGTGKSTQAQLWCDHCGAELINGDRAAIVPKDGTFWAYGVPYAGSSGVCKNEAYPIKTIVYLSQAPENTVTRLNGILAFRKVWEGCTADVWNKEDMEASIKTVSDLIASVPVFHLSCLPDESAVKALENELEKL